MHVTIMCATSLSLSRTFSPNSLLCLVLVDIIMTILAHARRNGMEAVFECYSNSESAKILTI